MSGDRQGVAVGRDLPGCVFDDECGNTVRSKGEWMCQECVDLVQLGRATAQERCSE